MKKKYLLYCAIVILGILAFNFILPMGFYSTDGHYFWGLAKFIDAGKLANSNAFWSLYPAGYSFLVGLFQILFPWITYKGFSIFMLILTFCAGPWVIRKAYARLHLKAWECLLFFLFSISGFYLAIYFIQVVVAAQIIGYLALPLFPALFFSKRKRDLCLAILLLILLYFTHSMTAFLIIFTTAVSAIFSQNQQRSKYLLLLLLPFLGIKFLHFILINVYPSTNYEDLPLNHILAIFHLETSYRLPDMFVNNFRPYEFFLSGIPLFFWILPAGLKKKLHPEQTWYMTLFGICLLIALFFVDWNMLFPIPWVMDRYFSFMWLAIAFSAPYLYKKFKVSEKKLFASAAILFIFFGLGKAFWRSTRYEPDNEDLINWIDGMKVFVEEDEGPIVFMFGPAGVPYAYAAFAPHDIYFLFPVNIPETRTLNLTAPLVGFYSQIPTATKLEDLLIKYNISFIVYSKEFADEFANLKNSKHYSLVSNYKDQAFAYDLSRPEQ